MNRHRTNVLPRRPVAAQCPRGRVHRHDRPATAAEQVVMMTFVAPCVACSLRYGPAAASHIARAGRAWGRPWLSRRPGDAGPTKRLQDWSRRAVPRGHERRSGAARSSARRRRRVGAIATRRVRHCCRASLPWSARISTITLVRYAPPSFSRAGRFRRLSLATNLPIRSPLQM